MIGHLTNYSGIQAHDTELFDHITGSKDQFYRLPYNELMMRWFKYQQISSVPIEVCETMFDRGPLFKYFIENLGVVLSIGSGEALLALYNFHNNRPKNDIDMRFIKELKVIGYFSTNNMGSILKDGAYVQLRQVHKKNDIYHLGKVLDDHDGAYFFNFITDSAIGGCPTQEYFLRGIPIPSYLWP